MTTDLQTFAATCLLLAGSGFALVAAIGVVRMPDLFCRMHAATKAGAFGVSLILLALAVAQPELRVLVQAAMIIAFFYLTAPIAAQMIGSAAVRTGVRMWRNPADTGTARNDGSPDSEVGADKPPACNTAPHKP